MKKVLSIILAITIVFAMATTAFAVQTAPTGGALVKSNIVYGYTITMNGKEIKQPLVDLYKTSDGRYYAMFASDGGKASKINWITGGPVTLDGVKYTFGVDGYTAVIAPSSSTGGPGYPQEANHHWEGSGTSWRYVSDGKYLKSGFLFENLDNSGKDYFGSSSTTAKVVGDTSRTDKKSFIYYLGSDGYAKTGSYDGRLYNTTEADIPVCAMIVNRIVNNKFYDSDGKIIKNSYISVKSSGAFYKADSSGNLTVLTVVIVE